MSSDEHRQEINTTEYVLSRAHRGRDRTIKMIESLFVLAASIRVMHLFSGQAERARIHDLIEP